MKYQMFLAVALLNAATVFAESSSTVQTQSGSNSAISVPARPSEGKIQAELELRPGSYVTTQAPSNSNGTKSPWGSFNTTAAGYQFNNTFYLGYTQWWSSTGGNSPFDYFDSDEGFIHFKANKLLDNGKGLSLSYETRAFVPTAGGRRDAGANFFYAIRNYVKVRQDFSSFFSLSLQEVIIPQSFSRPGTLSPGSLLAKSNPTFENRVYLIPEFNITPSLSLALPVMFHQTANALSTGASNKGSWSYFLWTWPELDYALDNNFTVGLSYMSDNFVKEDLSGFDFANGINNGLMHAVLRASL